MPPPMTGDPSQLKLQTFRCDAGDKRSLSVAAYCDALSSHGPQVGKAPGGGRPDRFRTIKICPKDLPAVPRQGGGAQDPPHRPLAPASSPVELTQSERR